jgi:hypothetical protein
MLGNWHKDSVRTFAADGEEWYTRVIQGGGVSWNSPPDSPVPVVAFRPTATADARNFEVMGDPGKWDASGYSEDQLRELLRRARGEGTVPLIGADA